MKPIFISLFLLLPCSQVLAGPSLEAVLGMLRQQTIASNERDVATLLKILPEKGTAITHPTGESATVDRKMMEDYLGTYFKSMKPGSYVYGARFCGVDAKDADTITVTLEVSESYVLIEKDVPKSSWYREQLTIGLEKDQPVVLKAVMEKTAADRIEGSNPAPAEVKDEAKPETMYLQAAWARKTKDLPTRIARLEGFMSEYLPSEEGGTNPEMQGYGDGTHIYAVAGCAWELTRAYVEAGQKEKAQKMLDWVQRYDSKTKLVPPLPKQEQGEAGK